MTGDLAIYLSKQMLWQGLVVCLPLVSLILLSGLLVSVLQSVTQIQDSSLSFIPKILVAILVLMLLGGWMLHQLTDYARHSIVTIPEMVR